MGNGKSDYLSQPVGNEVNFKPSNQPKKQRRIRPKKWFLAHKKPVFIAAATAAVLIIGIILFVNFTKTSDNKTFTGAAADYAKQLPGLSAAVKDTPNDPDARKKYAVALYATKDLKGAKEQYESASKLNDKDATVFNNLGNVYRDLGELDKATSAYRRAIELDPKALNPYVNLANVQLYSQNKPDDAIATYKQAIEKLPNSEQIELLLGIAYEQKGDLDNAKKTYQAILSRNPGNTAAKTNLERL